AVDAVADLQRRGRDAAALGDRAAVVALPRRRAGREYRDHDEDGPQRGQDHPGEREAPPVLPRALGLAERDEPEDEPEQDAADDAEDQGGDREAVGARLLIL